MYIWRGKNRRDRRGLLTSLEWVWGPPKKDESNIAERELELREEGEEIHVGFFRRRIRGLIGQYLETDDGKIEIDLVVKELDKEATRRDELHKKKLKGEIIENNDDDSINMDTEVAPELQNRQNIYEVFRRFDTDGSGAIDKDEMQSLIEVLNVPMTEEELDKLMNELDSDGGGGVDFEEFYYWFVNEANNQRKKNTWSYVKNLAKQGVFSGFKRLILEVEARNSIVDHAVEVAVKCSRDEYRVTKPPLYFCEICGQSFTKPVPFSKHKSDKKFHNEFLKEKATNEARFKYVNEIFIGAQGRKLLAHRLIFSEELLPMEERLKHAKPTPFRPLLSDPGSKRAMQLVKGMFVQGADAKAGIRPVPKKFGLVRQYAAPGRQKEQPLFQDVIVQMLYCRDDKVDVVIAPSTSSKGDVKFVWNGFASKTVQVIGEFNGWKPQNMECNVQTGKQTLIMPLGPGRYRYKYIIDGKEMLDEENSIIDDTPRGPTNFVLVINPAKEGNGNVGINLKHINLRNVQLLDDGAWAFATFLQTNSSIESVDFSYNCISDQGMQAIGHCITQIKKLHTLKLNGNGFGYDGCRYLQKSLDQSKTINHLELSGNRCGDDGAEIISQMIKFHESLQTLYFDSNHFGNDGCIYLAEGLLKNRTLQNLSLNGNRIYQYGIERLCESLFYNKTLRYLSLNNNPLGPNGAMAVGNLLLLNKSITYLDVSNTDVKRNGLKTGLKAINFALTSKNRSLKHLNLSNNGLVEDDAVEIALALYYNRGLTKIKLNGNLFDKKWLEPKKFFDCPIMPQLPSITNSIDRNIEIQKDPVLAQKYAVKEAKFDLLQDGLSNEFEGEWSKRGEWKVTDKVLEAKKALQSNNREEEIRIQVEEDYIKENYEKKMASLQLFIDSKAGADFILCVAKLITKHLKNLILFEKDELLPDDEIAALAAEIAAENNLSNNDPEPRQSFFGSIKSVLSSKSNKSPKSVKSSKKSKKIVFDDNNFKSAHIAIVSAIFIELGADRTSMFIHPEKLQQVLQAMALPANLPEAQSAVDASLVRPVYKIGFRKFANYIKDNARHIAAKNSISRMRIMTDLSLHPPVDEAKIIIMDSLSYSVKQEVVEEFRSTLVGKPKYACDFCKLRFSSELALQKHIDKRGGSNHIRYVSNQSIYDDQRAFLRYAKWVFTGSFFPAFYELTDVDKLPEDYYPQVIDSLGAEGRPIGVIEPNMTVRIKDLLGEYFQVFFERKYGWVKYKVGPLNIFRPACSDIPGFSWDGLETFENFVYYQVVIDPIMPIELKVRKKPIISSESCGHIKGGDIVECGAVFGDWLQIRYEGIEAAWVLYIAGGGGSLGSPLSKKQDPTVVKRQVLEKLPPPLQRHLSRICTKSPFFPKKKDLIIDEVEEKKYEEKEKLRRLLVEGKGEDKAAKEHVEAEP